MKLSDEVIAHVARLLQMAILTGTDLVDHLRMIRLKTEDVLDTEGDTVKGDVLFLDEVINVLDEMGREKLVEVLLAEEGLNTYIVSHGWTHPLLEKIEVIKEDNISRLE